MMGTVPPLVISPDTQPSGPLGTSPSARPKPDASPWPKPPRRWGIAGGKERGRWSTAGGDAPLTCVRPRVHPGNAQSWPAVTLLPLSNPDQCSKISARRLLKPSGFPCRHLLPTSHEALPQGTRVAQERWARPLLTRHSC